MQGAIRARAHLCMANRHSPNAMTANDNYKHGQPIRSLKLVQRVAACHTMCHTCTTPHSSHACIYAALAERGFLLPQRTRFSDFLSATMLPRVARIGDMPVHTECRWLHGRLVRAWQASALPDGRGRRQQLVRCGVLWCTVVCTLPAQQARHPAAACSHSAERAARSAQTNGWTDALARHSACSVRGLPCMHARGTRRSGQVRSASYSAAMSPSL